MVDSEKCRAFVALALDRESVARMTLIQEALAADRRAPRAEWTPPESMHVTLKFLGDIGIAEVEAARSSVIPLVVGPAPRLLAVRVTAFPSVERAGVVVALLEDPTGRVPQLAATIEGRLVALGHAPNDHDVFRPHVTLARVRPACDATAWLASHALACECVAPEVVLYRSDRGKGGPTYTRLAQARFDP